MITQRAKLRRLAFILSPCPRPSGVRRLLRARKSWRLHVPATRQCRRQPAPCQGNPTRNQPIIRLFRKARCCGPREKPALRRAGARSTVSRSPPRLTRAPARVRRSRELGLAQAVIKAFELGKLDRALVAGMGDGAAEEPQRHFGGQIRELRGRECDRTALPATGPERAPRARRRRRIRSPLRRAACGRPSAPDRAHRAPLSPAPA